MTSSIINVYDDFIGKYDITTYEEEYVDADGNHYDEEGLYYYSADEFIENEEFYDY